MKTLSLTIVGQLKSGKNGMQVTRSGHHYPKPGWAAWRDATILFISAQNRPKVAFDSRCRADVRYWSGDARRRDVPGMIDAICHCLERSGTVKDDSLLVSWKWDFMGLDREHPKAEIVITELDMSGSVL